MASAWGLSWGLSWGVSWGATAEQQRPSGGFRPAKFKKPTPVAVFGPQEKPRLDPMRVCVLVYGAGIV